MDIDTSYFNNYLNTIKDDQSASSKLQKSISGRDYSQASDDELMEVCKEFEAYFVEQIFKEMEKTIPESESGLGLGLGSSNQLVDYFKDNMIQELSKEAADQQQLGLAQMLYEQMKRNYSALTPEEVINSAEETVGAPAEASDSVEG